MDFQFRFENGYDFYELILLNKAVVRRNAFLRVFVPILRSVFVVGGLFFLITGCMFFFAGFHDAAMGAICILAGLLWFLLGAFYYRYGAWKSRRMLLKNLGSISISLNEKDIHELTSRSEARFSYHLIQEVCFYKNTYIVFLDKKHAFILSLNKLSAGQPDLLAMALEERCGKAVKQL